MVSYWENQTKKVQFIRFEIYVQGCFLLKNFFRILATNTNRLIKYVVEGVRTRLDRVYLEAIGGEQSAQNGAYIEHESNVDALQSELESLYTEILPVAQMSVQQQYLEHALCLTTSQDIQESERSEKALGYVGKLSTT
jgi:hypothetical protein